MNIRWLVNSQLSDERKVFHRLQFPHLISPFQSFLPSTRHAELLSPFLTALPPTPVSHFIYHTHSAYCPHWYLRVYRGRAWRTCYLVSCTNGWSDTSPTSGHRCRAGSQPRASSPTATMPPTCLTPSQVSGTMPMCLIDATTGQWYYADCLIGATTGQWYYADCLIGATTGQRHNENYFFSSQVSCIIPTTSLTRVTSIYL